MNQSQRNFLIERVEKLSKIRIKVLEDSIPEAPSLETYLLHAVMSGTFEIKSNDEIKEMITQKALGATDRKDWLNSDWGRNTKDSISFKLREFFIVPEEYQKKYNAYVKERDGIREKVIALHISTDTLVVRLKLASNSTLETMIKEVDDMGNLSLIDTKLKELTS